MDMLKALIKSTMNIFITKLHAYGYSNYSLKLPQSYLKLVSVIFYQFFIFPSNDSPSKTMTNVFYFI